MGRAPARDDYDAIVDLEPCSGIPSFAYALVKVTYAFDARGVRRAPAEALRDDVRDDAVQKSLPRGSDFVAFKPATDVAIVGSVYASSGEATASRIAWVTVGKLAKRVRAFGARALKTGGSRAPWIQNLEALHEVPLTRDEAYGGGGSGDRERSRRERTLRNLVASMAEAERVYPRNPYGKGYWALGSGDEIALPRLEDPDDLLTEERILRQHERPWVTLPLPWHMDWIGLDQFPRMPGAQDVLDGFSLEELPEVRRGLWPREWLRGTRSRPMGLAFIQEASLGMVWREAEPGAPVQLVGMHPEEDLLELRLPPPPVIEIEVDGSRERVEPRLTNLVFTPHEKKLTMTWAAVRRDLPRKFVPGVHGFIPLRLHVDGDRPIDYETPPPVYRELQKAEREGRIRPARARAQSAPGAIELSHGVLGDEPPVRDRDFVTPSAVERLGDVDVPTGRLLLREVDWVLEGASLPFVWARSYSSSSSWRAGSLGPGWSHPLEQALWAEDGFLLHRTADGREVYVARIGAGELALGQSVHHPLEGVTVRRVASDGYELLHADGWRASLTNIPRSVQTGPIEARITRLISPLGVTADVGYDAHGRLARLVLPSRHEVRFEHDACGRLMAVSAPTADGAQHAVVARYEHDGAGQLVSARDGAGNVMRYRYAGRLLVERVAAGGEVTRHHYEGAGAHARVTASVRVEGGARREVFFDPKRRVVVAIDALGRARSDTVDVGFRVTLARDAEGNEAHREHDESTGLCVSATDRLGGRSELLYDSAGHLAEETRPDGSRSVLDYDGGGHLVARTGPDGHGERWTWDTRGRLQARIDAVGASAVYDYEEEGPLARLLAPGEVAIVLGHDAAGQTNRVESPLGVRHIARDALGRPRKVTDEEGHVARLRFDPTGRLREVDHEGAACIRVERGPTGAIVRYGDGVHEVTLERDRAGLLVGVTCRDEALAVLHRDAEGRVTIVENAALDMHELRYDGRGLLAAESAADDALTRYRRDAEERLVEVLRPGNVESRYERDACGRIVRAMHEHGGESIEERFEHDRSGRIIVASNWRSREQEPGGACLPGGNRASELRFERDGAGRARRETLGMSERTVALESRYDARGLRVALESSLGLRVHVVRDASGAPAELCVFMAGSEEPFRIAFSRDRRGGERERRLPGGVVLRSDRDALGRVTRRRVLWENSVLGEASYSYAGLDRLVHADDSREGRSTMVHDARGHLVAVRVGVTGGIVRSADELGNLYRVPARDDHRYGAGGRLLEAYGVVYGYDDAGRRVTKETPDGAIVRYRWEGPSRLAEVELPEGRRVRYGRDAFGRCISRRVERREGRAWVLERERAYVWDGLSLLHEIEGGEITSFVRLDGTLSAIVQAGRCAPVLTDPLGVAREIVDETGALLWCGGIDSFGVGWREVERVRQPWRWPGHIEDEDTGLSMSLLRAYDPEAAQYLSPCPLGIASGPSLYGYLRDPLSAISPLGLGEGIEPHYGVEIPRCAEQIHVEMLLAALDRRDGSEGPRRRFEQTAPLPDPHVLSLGQWARYHP